MRIAVIGTGIAGLGAAYALARAHEVELFEKEAYAGGHTHTVDHREDGRMLPLDTGFIVHNEANYPNLVRLFRELGVRTQDSEMSFSVSCERCRIEYSARRPPRGRLLLEVARFLRRARATLGSAEERTLARYAADEGYSRLFRDHFLVPLAASIWSTGTERALDFPAGYALRFFDNHGMLGFRRRRWKTVVGGSREYVRALAERLPIQLRAEVRAVRRDLDGAEVVTAAGTRRFDGVVIATHGDQALRLLADPSDEERRILSAFRTTRNETVLHSDERFLPRRERARASWNYQLDDCSLPNGRPTITYYLNRLQALDEERHYCVTLNRSAEIAEESVIRRLVYEHPLVTFESVRAQPELWRLNGPRRTAFCGAWQGFGFHEDGLVSGLRAAAAFGAAW